MVRTVGACWVQESVQVTDSSHEHEASTKVVPLGQHIP